MVFVLGYAYPGGEDNHDGPISNSELISAAKAFIGKPLNDEHDDDKIIGKIINAKVIENGGIAIAADIDIMSENGMKAVERIINKQTTKFSVGVKSRGRFDENDKFNIEQKVMLHVAITDDPYMKNTDIKYIQNPEQALSQLEYLYQLRIYNNKLKEALYKANDEVVQSGIPSDEKEVIMSQDWQKQAEELKRKNEALEKELASAAEKKNEPEAKRQKKEEPAVVNDEKVNTESDAYKDIIDICKNNFGDNPEIAKAHLNAIFNEQKSRTEKEKSGAIDFVKQQYELAQKEPSSLLMKGLEASTSSPAVVQPLIDLISVCNKNSINSFNRIKELEEELKKRQLEPTSTKGSQKQESTIGQRLEPKSSTKNAVDGNVLEMWKMISGGVEKVDYDYLVPRKP